MMMVSKYKNSLKSINMRPDPAKSRIFNAFLEAFICNTLRILLVLETFPSVNVETSHGVSKLTVQLSSPQCSRLAQDQQTDHG